MSDIGQRRQRKSARPLARSSAFRSISKPTSCLRRHRPRRRLLPEEPQRLFHYAAGRLRSATGLEATMEVKVIKEGGRNYGVIQRSGLVTFATVVLKARYDYHPRSLQVVRTRGQWVICVSPFGNSHDV